MDMTFDYSKEIFNLYAMESSFFIDSFLSDDEPVMESDGETANSDVKMKKSFWKTFREWVKNRFSDIMNALQSVASKIGDFFINKINPKKIFHVNRKNKQKADEAIKDFESSTNRINIATVDCIDAATGATIHMNFDEIDDEVDEAAKKLDETSEELGGNLEPDDGDPDMEINGKEVISLFTRIKNVTMKILPTAKSCASKAFKGVESAESATSNEPVSKIHRISAIWNTCISAVVRFFSFIGTKIMQLIRFIGTVFKKTPAGAEA